MVGALRNEETMINIVRMQFPTSGPDISANLISAQDRGETLFVCGAGGSRTTPSRLALDAPNLPSRGGRSMEKCGCRSVIKLFSGAPFRLTDVNLTMPSTVLYA